MTERDYQDAFLCGWLSCIWHAFTTDGGNGPPVPQDVISQLQRRGWLAMTGPMGSDGRRDMRVTPLGQRTALSAAERAGFEVDVTP